MESTPPMAVEQEVFACEGFGQFTFEVGLVAGDHCVETAHLEEKVVGGWTVRRGA